jgi:23S rRNA (uracil1939-C5)-methyltransferase
MDERSDSGKIVEIDIADLAFDGKAVGYLDGKIVFLNGGLPGEKVQAEITRRKARFDQGRTIAILKQSPDRLKASCRHYEICGGCTWQDLDYSRQLFYKRKQVVDCLTHIGHIPDINVSEPIGCTDQFFYRNKMEFSFNTAENESFVLGLHHRGHFDQIFNIEECLLQSTLSNEIVAYMRQVVSENDIPAYDVFSHKGFLRFMMIREGRQTEQVMINIVTASDDPIRLEKIISNLTSRFSQITTIVNNINGSKSNIARGEYEHILFGPGYIEERLLNYTFRIYANSFFQTNSLQAERLYGQVFETLQPQKDDCLLDLYCGTGTIGICASGLVANVIGVELEPSAVKAALQNAAQNNIDNIEFQAGSVQDILRNNDGKFGKITSVIIDPPRAGMHPKALKGLVEMKIGRLVYVSCNPATFARDAAYLIQKGYRLEQVIPVDMFPHTMHIELVARFTL